MIKGGFKRIGNDGCDFQYKFYKERVHATCRTSKVSNFIRIKQKDYAGHLVRMPIERCEKQLMFNDDKYHRIGIVTPSLLEQVLKFSYSNIDNFINNSLKR